MKKTGAWLVRYALEQLDIRFTFGIPGVHNTEIYDEINTSDSIEPVLVTHEGCGAFMADAVSRTSGSVGALLIVPAAGVTHAASGIGEAFLDGIPMLVIAGGIRSDSEYKYQLHDIDQHALLKPITKACYKISNQNEILSTFYEAYEVATSGEPGPVFIEVPVNIQLYAGDIGSLQPYADYRQKKSSNSVNLLSTEIDSAVTLLLEAKSPGLFLGWGAVDVSYETSRIAELLGAPVSTTLQGLSAFPANHELHTGMSFGPAAVPAATNAFKNCDALLAVGTRFAEIATGSFGVTVPEKLIHVDINPNAINANYPAQVAIEGDANVILPLLLSRLEQILDERQLSFSSKRREVAAAVKLDKDAYRAEWYAHSVKGKVNPARFFDALRLKLPDDGLIVVDDGNHTFLTAELMGIHSPRGMISPTDFNCMGYAVPATIATKLANPDKDVVSIIGDGAFLMTCMELLTANHKNVGAVFTIFNDGELSQISQAQALPYNRKTCTVLPETKFQGVALATGVEYIRMETNDDIVTKLEEAWSISKMGRPVILDVNIDYSKKTRFTQGIVGTNLKRLPYKSKIKMVGRALVRKVTG